MNGRAIRDCVTRVRFSRGGMRQILGESLSMSRINCAAHSLIPSIGLSVPLQADRSTGTRVPGDANRMKGFRVTKVDLRG